MNPTETFETLVKKQQEAISQWTNNSKTILEDSIQAMTTPFKASVELLNENAKANQNIFSQVNPKDMTENMQNAPKFFQNWLSMQQEYAQKWQDLFQSNNGTAFEKFQANNKTFSESFKQTIASWEAMINDAKKAFTGDFKNPFAAVAGDNAFLSHFFKAYEDMQIHWKKILEDGVMKGMFTKEQFHSFFPNDSFNKIVDSLMGLNSIENLKKSTEAFDSFYETYFEKLESIQKDAQNAVSNLNGQVETNTKNTILEPIGKLYADFLKQFDQSKPIIGDFNLKADVKAMSEKYFNGRKTFLDYIEKNMSFQNKVYGKAKDSMTETMENFWTLYQTEGKAPNYEAFMNSWLKITQVRISEILNSEELKQLQKDLTASKDNVITMMNDMVKEYTQAMQAKTEIKTDAAQSAGKQEAANQVKQTKAAPTASKK
ncbi:MAG: hypothetical protein WAR77_03620 [Saprospiraceae bacterium]